MEHRCNHLPNDAAAQSGKALHLWKLKGRMVNELERMQYTQDELVKSSKGIAQSIQTFGDYGSKLATASALLSGLRNSANSDSRHVWAAFIFLASCSGFVVAKRLGIWRLTYFCVVNTVSLGVLHLRFIAFFYHFVSSLAALSSARGNDPSKTLVGFTEMNKCIDCCQYFIYRNFSFSFWTPACNLTTTCLP